MPKTGELKEKIDAGAGGGPIVSIKAPTSAAGVAASNAAGKTPFGKVINVPNNTKKGYAEGGEVQPQTNWLGLPSNEEIVKTLPAHLQFAYENPASSLPAQVAPSTLVQDAAKSVGEFMRAPDAREALKAEQFGIVTPEAQAQTAQAATPIENVNLGAPEPAMAGQPIQQPIMPEMPGAGRYASGVRAEAAAQGQMGREQELAAQQEQARIQQIETQYQDNYKALEAERSAIIDDIKASHIDPNRFIGQMGAGAKVGTAIGLLLSGFGSGLTGKENMAMQFLNKQIDNDIYAQTQELGKKNNLLSATMAQFGNLKDATTMARVITQDLYKAKIEEAAARSMDPMAKARAEQAIAQMELKTAPALQQLAKKQTVQAALKQGAMKPAEAVPHLVPDHDRAKAFEEVSKIETAQDISKGVNKLFDDMEKIQTGPNAVTNPLQRSRQIEAANVEMFSLLKPIFGALSESDKTSVLASKIGVLDDAATRAYKRQTIERIARDNVGSTPVLDAYGISMDKSFMTPKTRLNPAMFGKGK